MGTRVGGDHVAAVHGQRQARACLPGLTQPQSSNGNSLTLAGLWCWLQDQDVPGSDAGNLLDSHWVCISRKSLGEQMSELHHRNRKSQPLHPGPDLSQLTDSGPLKEVGPRSLLNMCSVNLPPSLPQKDQGRAAQGLFPVELRPREAGGRDSWRRIRSLLDTDSEQTLIPGQPKMLVHALLVHVSPSHSGS